MTIAPEMTSSPLTGRHVAPEDAAPTGLAIVRTGGRHAAYGTTTDLVLNAGDAAQLLGEGSGLSHVRLLTDPTSVPGALDAALARLRSDRRRLPVHTSLTRAGRARRADLDLRELLLHKAAGLLAEAQRTLGVSAGA